MYVLDETLMLLNGNLAFPCNPPNSLGLISKSVISGAINEHGGSFFV